MKIAVVYNGKVKHAMEVKDLSEIPTSFTFKEKGKQITVPIGQVELLQTTYDIQPDDMYVPGKGTYRLVGK
jgi:hypothetical protein